MTVFMIFLSFGGIVVSMAFGSSDTSTKVTCSGRNELRHVNRTATKSRVKRAAIVVVFSRFGAQQVYGVRLSCTPLMEQMYSQDCATT